MADPVDTHDPAGMAAFLRERAQHSREFVKLTSEEQIRHFMQQWQKNILPHFAFRFEQAATMVETQAAEIEHLKKARDRDHEQAWMNGAAALRYRRALEAIAAFDPGKFRPLADEIAIWKQATDALQDEPRADPFYVKHYVGQAHPSIKGNGFDGLTIGDEREEAQEFVDWVNSKIGVEAEKEPDEPAICEKCSQGLSTHHLIIDGAGNAAALCPVVTPPPNRGGNSQ